MVTDRSVDIDPTQSLRAFLRAEHGYADIVENLYTKYVAPFSALLERALHYRVGSSITENGEFRTAIAFHLIPR